MTAPLKDFALQDEIVQKIVTTLKVRLALRAQGIPSAKPPTTWTPMTTSCAGWRLIRSYRRDERGE